MYSEGGVKYDIMYRTRLEKKNYDGCLYSRSSERLITTQGLTIDNKYWNYKIKYGGIIEKEFMVDVYIVEVVKD